MTRTLESEPLTIQSDGATLIGERWGQGSPTVMLLHSGVSDRRGWHATIDALMARGLGGTIIAYDRRGFGESAPSAEPYSPVADLVAVLDACGSRTAWLVGSSAGGRLALDTALLHGSRVEGLLLIAPAVSGRPEPEDLDPDTARLGALLEQSAQTGDLEELNRLEMWLWLDGPGSEEGRVGGSVRELAIAMNARVLAKGTSESEGLGADAWSHLEEVHVPTTVACGDLDVPVFVAGSEELARRLPRGAYRRLEGLAHLPYLEQPATIADLIAGTVSGAGLDAGRLAR